MAAEVWIRMAADRRPTGHSHTGAKRVASRGRSHLTFVLDEHTRGYYSFEIHASGDEPYEIGREECKIYDTSDTLDTAAYRVEYGEVVETNLSNPPAASSDRLDFSKLNDPFRRLHDQLLAMSFYSFVPEEMREGDKRPRERLSRHGSNIANVLYALEERDPAVVDLIEDYLRQVVPGIESIETETSGRRRVLRFDQEAEGYENDPWSFYGDSMSDGTLQALGVLTAIFQTSGDTSTSSKLVGIEEPEASLHPGAADVLVDALDDASESRQILVTSHSPDLLDNRNLSEDQILAVVSRVDISRIGPIDEASKSALRDELSTVGELLRKDYLHPDEDQTKASSDDIDLYRDLDDDG